MARTKQEKTESGKSKFEEAIEKLNKQYGAGTILTLDGNTPGDYDTISSGTIGMDYITLGVGGFVKGKLYELMGWEGVGKSTVCGLLASHCQENGGKVLYIDSEHAIDKAYFKKLGIDTSKLLISQPSCGEEGFNIAIEMIESGEIDLVIIDSDNGMIPKKVIDGEVGDSAIGRKAMMNSNAIPKLKKVLAINKVCVIITSQYREKIGMMFGDPKTTQGGHALKYYSDCRMELTKTLIKDGLQPIGFTAKIKTTKNKMSSPFRTTEFNVMFKEGLDTIEELITLGNTFEVIRKYGKSITYGESKFDADEFRVLLKDNPEFYNEVKEKVIYKIKNGELPESLIVDSEDV